MDFRQTIFMNKSNAPAASKGKSANASKSSGNTDFYKIIQNLSSPGDNGRQKINAAENTSGGASKIKEGADRASSAMATGVDAEAAGINDIIDEDVINAAVGAKSSDSKTGRTDSIKFSAEEIKAIISDKNTLEEISAALNIPMEVIEAFIAQLTLQTAGGDPVGLTDIVGAAVSPDMTAESGVLEVNEKFSDNISKEDFIEKLKQFAETGENERTFEKYLSLNEFLDSVKNNLESNGASGKFVNLHNPANALQLNATEDKTADFVTEKILDYLNVDADSLSDFEIVSIEKLLGGNENDGERLAGILEKLRNPLAGITDLREFNAGAAEIIAEAEIEAPELVPGNIGLAVKETPDYTDEADEKIETYDSDPAAGSDEIQVNSENILGDTRSVPAEIKRYPDMIAHYTRAANSIQNLILNNKSGENFQVKMLLRPEGLGEMLVKVTYNKGNISLNVTTDNALAQRELLNQAAELRNTLAEHDFSLMNFDVANKNPDDRNQYGREESSKNKNNAGTVKEINSGGDGNIKVSTQDIIRLRSIYQNRTVYRQV